MFKISDLSTKLKLTENIHISIETCFSRLISIKSINYTSNTKLSKKVNIFIVGFKFKDFFFIKKQITIISIIL